MQLTWLALLLNLGVQFHIAQTANADPSSSSPFYSVLLKDWYSSVLPAERVLHIRDQVQWNAILTKYENAVPRPWATAALTIPNPIDSELKRLRETPIDFKKNAIIVLTYIGPNASSGFVRISNASIFSNRLELTAEGMGIVDHGNSQQLSVLILEISAEIEKVQVTWHDQTIASPFDKAYKSCISETEKERLTEQNRYRAPLWQQPRNVTRNEPIKLFVLDPVTPERIEALKVLLKHWKLNPAHCRSAGAELTFQPIKGIDIHTLESEILTIPGVRVHGITPVKNDGLKRSGVGW